MVRWWVIALLLPATAAAGDRREAVLDLLQAFEEPVRQVDLAKLGDGVDTELMAIADDPSVPGTRRGNAIAALQWYPTERVHTWLAGHLRAPQEAQLRRKVVLALAAFGAGAVQEIASTFADPDPELRIAAAQALGTIRDPAARSALEGRLATETDPSAKAAIAQALAPKGGATP